MFLEYTSHLLLASIAITHQYPIGYEPGFVHSTLEEYSSTGNLKHLEDGASQNTLADDLVYSIRFHSQTLLWKAAESVE